MEKSLKSPKSKRSRPKYAYNSARRGMVYTALGDPIIFEGPGRYVCGGCFLLLKSMDVRFWSRSPLLEMLPMLPIANDSLRVFQVRLRAEYPLAQSFFIPELSPRGRIHFHGLLFNVPLSLGDTRQGKRCISMEMSEKIVPSLSYGERASWMRQKLTDLDAGILHQQVHHQRRPTNPLQRHENVTHIAWLSERDRVERMDCRRTRSSVC